MTNKADLRKFLVDLSQVLTISKNKDKEAFINITVDHLWGKVYNKELDYKKAISWLIDNCKDNFFPDIPTIANALHYCEVKPFYRESVDAGSLLVITLPSGFTHEFTVSSIGRSINDIKADIKRKFGDCTYKFYPKGTVIIGGKVYMP